MLALDGMHNTFRELHQKTVTAGKAGVSQVSAIEPYLLCPDWTPVFAHFQSSPRCVLCFAPVALTALQTHNSGRCGRFQNHFGTSSVQR